MKRRKRIFVRQSLAYREGTSSNPGWSVGYWDGKSNVHADEAFRVFVTKPTEAEAIESAKFISQTRKKEFIYG